MDLEQYGFWLSRITSQNLDLLPTLHLDGSIDHLEACLVAKGYAQIFGLFYGDIFSLVVKMTLCLLMYSHCYSSTMISLLTGCQ